MRKKILVLTGAGISAESGLRTFRDSDGLWENYRVEDVATPEAFRRDPELVLRFYNVRRKACAGAQPNAAHLGLADLEKVHDVRIVTQNIDDLHERAGSSWVLHLHGEIVQKRSVRNDTVLYPYTEDIFLGDKAPDGGQFRPHIVWFGEAVPHIETALDLVVNWAQCIVLIGSSLQVYPAAGLLSYADPAIPKIVLDKSIPDVRGLSGLTCIEKPATQGIRDVMELLSRA